MAKDIVVKKSNDLARSGFQLPLIEYRFINLCTGSIFHKNIVDEDQECYVSIEDYASSFSMTTKEAKKQFKAIRENLPLRVVETTELDGDPIPWITEAGMHTSDEMYVKFHEDMLDNLFGLTGGFISYNITNIIPLDSQYAVRLYEIAKSVAHEYAKFRLDVNLEQLKWMMGVVDKYKDYGSFKRLLNSCIASINEHTDLRVSFIERKLDKAVAKLVLQVEEKVPTQKVDTKLEFLDDLVFQDAMSWRERANKS